ncbi:hypothetical protein [Peribacillus glennii]|nr:hypothetical protein [Peribacillus glennii]
MKWQIACIQLDISFGHPNSSYGSAENKILEAAKPARTLSSCRDYGQQAI